jgi:ligand-binding SRPBCC domain-containing protein
MKVKQHTHELRRSQILPRPLGEVFAFFSDAANLERITPGFLHFKILTPLPIHMQPGTLIDYRIRICGIPRRWRTLIEEYEPGRRFVDVQLKGPYALWRHRHEFEEVPGGTRVSDVVHYRLPLGPLGLLAHALFVRRMLREIFDFRQRAMVEIFGPFSRGAGTTPSDPLGASPSNS